MKYLKNWRWWAAMIPISIMANVLIDNFIIVGAICVIGSIAACYTIDIYDDYKE